MWIVVDVLENKKKHLLVDHTFDSVYSTFDIYRVGQKIEATNSWP